MRKRFFIPSVVFVCVALFASGEAWARPVADDGFVAAKKIETRYFTLFLASGVDEGALIQRLNIGPGHKILAGQALTGEAFSMNSLADLLDTLFTWICGVLDMNLYSYRGNIKVAQSADQMEDIYRKLYGAEGDARKGYYIYDLNTIYITEENFTKEILGHEVAHAVISNFFVVQPPQKVAEVLAGYIEFQLRKPAARK